MSRTARTVLGWLPAGLWCLLIFVLSSRPALPSPASVTDKQAHALVYGILATLVLMAMTRWRWRAIGGAGVLAAFLMATAYGVSDEFHQMFVPGRSPEVADVVADAAGAAVALAAAWAWAILLGRRASASRP